MFWLTDVVDRAHATLLAGGPAHPARIYLAGRGVTDAEIVRYKLGYWHSPPVLQTCTPEFWDWSRKFGYTRILFPLTDPFGTPIGLQVRHLYGVKGYENFILKPRELYVPLFGLHVALPEMYAHERVVLVEGVFDYFAAVKVAPDTLCTLTANVSLSVRRLLSRYVSLAICLFDMDAAGRRGAYRLAGLPVPELFRQKEDQTRQKPRIPPCAVMLPSYSAHDPADLLKEGKREELQRLVLEQPLVTSFAQLAAK